jgi:hypothetical protein
MGKHTPGPWKAVPQHTTVAGFWEENGINIEGPNGEEIIGTEGIFNGEFDEANAALIAAAPELLEALKEAATVLARLDTLRHIEPQFPALDKARAAIAKAESHG